MTRASVSPAKTPALDSLRLGDLFVPCLRRFWTVDSIQRDFHGQVLHQSNSHSTDIGRKRKQTSRYRTPGVRGRESNP